MANVKVRFTMSNGSYTTTTVSQEGLVSLYKCMDMNRMFILVDEDGTFSAALNPRYIVGIYREQP